MSRELEPEEAGREAVGVGASKSSAAVEATETPAPYKRILIVGQTIEVPDDIKALYKEAGCLLITHKDLSDKKRGQDVSIEDVLGEIGKGRIDEKTIVSIYGHGEVLSIGHGIEISNNPVSTSKLFSEIGKLAKPISPDRPDVLSPVNIHLFSCYGGSAVRDLSGLPVGSTIVAHAPENKTTLARDANNAIRNLAQVANGRALHDMLMNFEMENISIGVKLNDGSTNCLTLRPPALDLAVADSIKTFLDHRSNRTRDHFKSISSALIPSTINLSDIPSKDVLDSLVDRGIDDYQRNLVINNVIYSKKDEDYEKVAKFIEATKKPARFFTYEGNNTLLDVVCVKVSMDGSFVGNLNTNTNPAKILVMKILLERGANPDHASEGRKPLLERVGFKEEAMLLLKYGANLSKKAFENTQKLKVDLRDLLEFARDPEIIKEIVLKVGATREKHAVQLSILAEATKDPKTERSPFEDPGVLEALYVTGQDRTGKSPLHFAGSAQVARSLIELGISPDVMDHECITPLLYARSDEVISALESAGAKTGAVDSNGRNALFYAKTPRDVERFVSLGLDPKSVDKYGLTPLNTVKSVDVMIALKKRGADPNALNMDGRTPLNYANSEEQVKALVQIGANHFQKGKQGMTPLHFLAYSDKPIEVLNAMIEIGADPNSKDEGGMSPLHIIAYKSNLDVAKYFIEIGADPKAKNIEGSIPLDFAQTDELIKLLVVAGGVDRDNKKHFLYLNSIIGQPAKSPFDNSEVMDAIYAAGKDDTGKTPLHFATTPSAAAALLEAGAFVLAMDNEGKTPLDRAKERDDAALVDLLEAKTHQASEAGLSDRAGPAGGAASGVRVADARVSSAAEALRARFEHASSPPHENHNIHSQRIPSLAEKSSAHGKT